MKQLIGWCSLALLAAAGCGTKVMVAPRINLVDHEIVGVIEFRSSARGKLAEYTTRTFVDAARRDQGLVRMVGLGTESQVLADLGQTRLDQKSYQRLGDSRQLKTIIVGTLDVSDIRPSISLLPTLESARITAEVDAVLSVEMIETATGASLWSATAKRTETVGEIRLFGGRDVMFDAEDPEAAYGELVRSLVRQVAADFQVTWVRK